MLVLLVVGFIVVSLGAEILPAILGDIVSESGYWRKPAFWICIAPRTQRGPVRRSCHDWCDPRLRQLARLGRQRQKRRVVESLQ